MHKTKGAFWVSCNVLLDEAAIAEKKTLTSGFQLKCNLIPSIRGAIQR